MQHWAPQKVKTLLWQSVVTNAPFAPQIHTDKRTDRRINEDSYSYILHKVGQLTRSRRCINHTHKTDIKQKQNRQYNTFINHYCWHTLYIILQATEWSTEYIAHNRVFIDWFLKCNDKDKDFDNSQQLSLAHRQHQRQKQQQQQKPICLHWFEAQEAKQWEHHLSVFLLQYYTSRVRGDVNSYPMYWSISRVGCSSRVDIEEVTEKYWFWHELLTRPWHLQVYVRHCDSCNNPITPWCGKRFDSQTRGFILQIIRVNVSLEIVFY